MRLIDRWFELEEINGAERCPTYLFRWTLLKTPWFSVYLHHFVGDDWSRDLHDHPKRFISIGLWGSYIEETFLPLARECPCDLVEEHVAEEHFRAPWIRTFAAEHTHRLRLEPGKTCWTLVIVLKAVRNWGFWHKGQWIPWRQYVRGPEAEKAKNCPS